MTGIDSVLNEMGEISLDPRLDAIEDAVIAKVGARQARMQARRNLAMTSILALSAGVFVSTMAPKGVRAERMPSLTSAPAIAPSNLLAGTR
ncbi:hypothetical protein [Sphingobium sp. SCG-1]|uniref:hypothetical protein n=1 Tax=Sphingobium sp. SCG-1 TaxID=2072936 RepID=UPI0011AB40DF|nr:hypothetical protein [Sphingobium sp. SCG-1]